MVFAGCFSCLSHWLDLNLPRFSPVYYGLPVSRCTHTSSILFLYTSSCPIYSVDRNGQTICVHCISRSIISTIVNLALSSIHSHRAIFAVFFLSPSIQIGISFFSFCGVTSPNRTHFGHIARNAYLCWYSGFASQEVNSNDRGKKGEKQEPTTNAMQYECCLFSLLSTSELCVSECARALVTIE